MKHHLVYEALHHHLIYSTMQKYVAAAVYLTNEQLISVTFLCKSVSFNIGPDYIQFLITIRYHLLSVL